VRRQTANRIRAGLVLAGIAVIGIGAALLVSTTPPAGLLGIGLWAVAAVVAHDAVLVPAVTLIAQVLFGRQVREGTAGPDGPARPGTGLAGAALAGAPLPSAALALTRALLVAAALVSVVVVPEILARRRGVADPTILPNDYGHNLLGLWVIVAVLAGVVLLAGVVAAALRARMRRSHT